MKECGFSMRHRSSNLKKNISSSRRSNGWSICKRRVSASIPAAAARSYLQTVLCITNHHVGADTLQKISDPTTQLFEGRLLCENPGGRNQIDRSRAQCADVNRRRDSARERSGETGNDERRRLPVRAVQSSLRLRKKAKTRPDCAPMSSRSIKAVCTIFIATNVTTMCG